MLQAVDTIIKGNVVLVAGNRQTVSRVFSNDICVYLQLDCEKPNVIHADNYELEEGAIIATCFERGSMIPVIAEALRDVKLDAVLDQVALALFNPAEYKESALAMLDKISEPGSISVAQEEEAKKVRYVLRVFNTSAIANEAGHQAEFNRIGELLLAREAAYKAFADHQHDMATDLGYRATAEGLMGKPR
jgi:hypothetical protein